MATVDDRLGRSSLPPHGTSAPSPTGGRSRFSVHGALGGSAVADVILWRRKHAALLLLGGATAAWFVFEIAGYSFISLVANTLLLLIAILFFWARSAALLNRPLPPLPNLEIPDRVAEKLADEVRPYVNRVLDVGRRIALGGDRKLFLEVILCLWAISYIGSFFSLFTLLYIGVALCLVIPVLYDKYQDHIDEKIALVQALLLNQYENILVKTGKSVKKEKKKE